MGKGTRRSQRPMRCQAPGCAADIVSLGAFNRRCRICNYHSSVERLMIEGRPHRFCQQCNCFHDLLRFDGQQRGCREKLAKHNARRRGRAQTGKNSASLTTSLTSGQPGWVQDITGLGFFPSKITTQSIETEMQQSPRHQKNPSKTTPGALIDQIPESEPQEAIELPPVETTQLAPLAVTHTDSRILMAQDNSEVCAADLRDDGRIEPRHGRLPFRSWNMYRSSAADLRKGELRNSGSMVQKPQSPETAPSLRNTRHNIPGSPLRPRSSWRCGLPAWSADPDTGIQEEMADQLFEGRVSRYLCFYPPNGDEDTRRLLGRQAPGCDERPNNASEGREICYNYDYMHGTRGSFAGPRQRDLHPFDRANHYYISKAQDTMRSTRL